MKESKRAVAAVGVHRRRGSGALTAQSWLNRCIPTEVSLRHTVPGVTPTASLTPSRGRLVLDRHGPTGRSVNFAAPSSAGQCSRTGATANQAAGALSRHASITTTVIGLAPPSGGFRPSLVRRACRICVSSGVECNHLSRLFAFAPVLVERAPRCTSIDSALAYFSYSQYLGGSFERSRRVPYCCYA